MNERVSSIARHLTRATSWLVVIVSTVGVPAAAAGATPADADERAGAPSIQDLLRVRFEAGGAVVRTALESTTADGEPTQLPLRDVDGAVSVWVVGGVEPGSERDRRRVEDEWGVVPRSCAIRVVRTSKDQAVTIEIQWRAAGRDDDDVWQPGMLDVQQSIQVIAGPARTTRLIRLLARGSVPAGEANPTKDEREAGHGVEQTVRLIVNEVGSTGNTPVNVNLAAPNFLELKRRHAKPVEEFLRPLFGSVGQEAVFAADPLEAFQVFANDWVADGPTSEHVDTLLPSLVAGDHRRREQTMGQLVRLGRRGAAALLRLDRAKLSAEQNLRVDNVLRRYFPLPKHEADRLRDDPAFLLDCLHSDESAVRAAAWERLRANPASDGVKFDPTGEAVTRSGAITALRRRFAETPDPGGP